MLEHLTTHAEILFVMGLGLGMTLHYGAMAAAAKRAPAGMRLCYIIAAFGGFTALILAPGDLVLAKDFALLGAAAALYIAWQVWRQGVHVCDLMDHAASLRAAKRTMEHLSNIERRARVDAEYLTPSTLEAVWAAEDREKARL